MDKRVVRASYESCMDATARLASYAMSNPLPNATEISARQDILAADDLIAFCIHARRLIDNVGLYKLADEVTVNCSGEPVSIWKLMGALIHHNEMMILRCATRLRMLKARVQSKTDDEFWKSIIPELQRGSYSEPVPPLVFFKSDKVQGTVVGLVDVLQVFSQELFPAVVKKASNEGLYLYDDPFKDVDISEKALSVLAHLRGSN